MNKSILTTYIVLLLSLVGCSKEKAQSPHDPLAEPFLEALQDTIGLQIALKQYVYPRSVYDGKTYLDLISGLKNGKLWIGLFEKISEEPIKYKSHYTWTGEEPIASNITISLPYELPQTVYYLDATSKGVKNGNNYAFIVRIIYAFQNSTGITDAYGYPLDAWNDCRLIIDHNGAASTNIIPIKHPLKDPFSLQIKTWFDNSYLLQAQGWFCYSSEAKLLYELKSPPDNAYPVSLEEGITYLYPTTNTSASKNISVLRVNYKMGTEIWKTSFTHPDIPDDAIINFVEVTSKTDTDLHFTISTTLYSGETKEFSFTVNTTSGIVSFTH